MTQKAVKVTSETNTTEGTIAMIIPADIRDFSAQIELTSTKLPVYHDFNMNHNAKDENQVTK